MKKILYILTLALFAITACTEDFHPELGSTYSRLVVQGSISNERKAHQVQIKKSADYFDNSPAPTVSGATVTISDGSSTFNLTEVSPGLYETDTLAGEIGKTYTLSINAEGKDFTASCYLDQCPPIDSINFGYYDYGDSYEIEDTILYVLMNAQEPATPNNFYLWNVYRNDTLQSDTLSEKTVYDDEFVNGNYMYDLGVQYVEAGHNDTITLEMLSVSEEYADYFYHVMNVTVWNMGPLGGPPANPVGNIIELNSDGNNNNDPVGFFLAYSVERITDIVPPMDEWTELEWY